MISQASEHSMISISDQLVRKACRSSIRGAISRGKFGKTVLDCKWRVREALSGGDDASYYSSELA